MDYHVLPPVDVYLLCESDAAVPLLLEALDSLPARTAAEERRTSAAAESGKHAGDQGGELTLAAVARALDEATVGIDRCITRLPLGWHGGYAHFRHPLDYIGFDVGGGVGAGPGITVGAALALKGSGRLAIGLMGDGDFLMGNTAVWTAAHYGIPCLTIVCNNRSYYNDELHQERVAVSRGRPAENRWIGQRISDPDIDIAAMARAQGASAIGPVTSVEGIRSAVKEGVETVRAGGVCVIDARVMPGYDAE
jgi:thiamine pyrophosphate-dependent acetolactate synthase large subunit-like protein